MKTRKNHGMRVVLLGFVPGAVPPAAYAIGLIINGIEYRSSLSPHDATCGMDMLLAYVLLLFVSPVCGVLGGFMFSGLHFIVKFLSQVSHKYAGSRDKAV